MGVRRGDESAAAHTTHEPHHRTKHTPKACPTTGFGVQTGTCVGLPDVNVSLNCGFFHQLPFPARSDPPQSSVLSHLPGSTITPVSVPQGTLWYTAVVPGPASYQTLRYGTQRQYHKPYSVSTMLHSISTRSRMLLRKGTYLVASEALARGRSSLGPSS